MKYRVKLFTAVVGWLFFACIVDPPPPPPPPEPVPELEPAILSKAQVAAFFGKTQAELKAKLVFVHHTNSQECLQYIDFSHDSLFLQTICAFNNIQSPLLSPDGNLVTFWTGTPSSGGNVYVCKLKPGATPILFTQGYDPHWWVGASGQHYLVYCTGTGTMNWPNPGKTLQQGIDTATLQPTAGLEVELAPYSLNGGLSKDGWFLATAYQSTGIYDRRNQKWYSVIQASQACNGSICPSSRFGQAPTMMYLTLGEVLGDAGYYDMHKAIVIADTNALGENIRCVIPCKPGLEEWQKPEWSTHDRYAVALGRKSTDWDLYLLDLQESPVKRTRVVLLNSGSFKVFPHLWVPEEY